MLSSLFDLFSVALLIPFLNLLFKPNELMTVKPEFSMNFEALYGIFKFYTSNVIVEHGAEFALLMISLLIILIVTLKNICRFLALYYMVPLRNNVVKDLRDQMFQHVLVLPLSYFSSERKGDLLTRMANDMYELEYAIFSSLEGIFKEPFNIIIALIALIWISPMLTLIIFLCLPVIVFFLGTITKSLKNQARKGQSKLDTLMSMFEETLMGIRIIKAFNAQDYLGKKFKQHNLAFTKVNIKGNRLLDAASPMSETLTIAILAFILWIGGRMVLNNDGGMTADIFIGFVGIFSRLIPPAKAFSTSYGKLQKGIISLNRIEEVLQSEEKIVEHPMAQPIHHFNETIEFRNVSFSYNNEPVLKNINLTIRKGQTVALVGPSGGGKSTFTDLIPRFYDPTEGQVMIDGVDIRKYKILELRKLMGMVSQESILFNDSIYYNIAFGQPGAKADQVEEAAQIANAHGFIMDTENGYQTNIGDRGNKLSGGQKQRISIARAVFKNPQIMILDEATSALDTTSERLVQDALSNVMKNRTTIVIAHRLSTIVNSDLIVVLDKGEIVQSGTHQELLKEEGLYKQLNDMQQLGD
jgi:subfamily B ATP-binding cassette protein MsbA